MVPVMFTEIIQKFAEKTPITLMVHALLERLLNNELIDKWFGTMSINQYTRKIMFSSVLGIMLQVVCKTRSSVHSEYMNSDNVGASIVALYDKLKCTETNTARELVKYISGESEWIIDSIGGRNKPLLPNYRIKFLDGNCIESTEHRIKPLRETKAGALPGKSLVVFDPQLELAIDVIPCEDGHAQERSLLGKIIETIIGKDLLVADRNFCVLWFLFKIIERSAFFAIRQHQNMPYKPLSCLEYVGDTETGEVYEQDVLITSEDGKEREIRRIVIKLYQPTRDGDTEIGIFTNLPKEDADAIIVSNIYRSRWGIETAFQKLERYFESEINTLGYPKAALFGFCVGLVAFNIYSVVMAALRAAHPENNIKEEVSEYYISEEVSSTYAGMLIAVDDADFSIFRECSIGEFGIILLYLASRVNLSKFRKSKRGPKKPRTPRTKFKGQPHVSTARLLKQDSG